MDVSNQTPGSKELQDAGQRAKEAAIDTAEHVQHRAAEFAQSPGLNPTETAERADRGAGRGVEAAKGDLSAAPQDTATVRPQRIKQELPRGAETAAEPKEAAEKGLAEATGRAEGLDSESGQQLLPEEVGHLPRFEALAGDLDAYWSICRRKCRSHSFMQLRSLSRDDLPTSDG